MTANFCTQKPQVNAEGFCSRKEFGKSKMAGNHNSVSEPGFHVALLCIGFSSKEACHGAGEKAKYQAMS